MSTDRAERALCGYAAPYGPPSDRGHVFEPHSFTRFLASGLGAYLRHEHRATITHRGVEESVGTVREFRNVGYPMPGLLMLAYLSDGPGAEQLLNALRTDVAGWGLSIGLWEYEDQLEAYGIGEVSVTRSPAFDDAAVLGVGHEALGFWELLAGEVVTHGAQAVS